MKILILGFIILSNLSAYAGNEVGNGGDGIECKDQREIKLLDFVEAETIDKRKIPVQYGSDPYKLVETIIAPLREMAPKLFDHYNGRLNHFKSRAQFLAGHKLRDIKDSFELVIAIDCKIIQLAIRQDNPKKENETFLFDEDAWKRMSVTHQAGLILHEIIYEHFWDLGERNSIKARSFNALLFSTDLKTMKKNELKAFFMKEKIAIYL